MVFQVKRVRSTLARIVTLAMLALLSTTAVAYAQDRVVVEEAEPLTVSIKQVSPEADSVPLGSDVQYQIAVVEADLADTKTIEGVTTSVTATDIQGQEVEATLTKADGGYTVDVSNVTMPLTLDVSVMASMVTVIDQGSLGTSTETVDIAVTESVELSVAYPDLSEVGGVGTPGYWKRHHDVWEALPIIVIGDDNMNWVCDVEEEPCLSLSNEDALYLLDAKNYNEGKDKRHTLYRSVIAAWLNVLAGNEDSCISDTIDATIAWLADAGNPLVDDGKDAVKGKFWSSEGNELYKVLDVYNNLGSGCAVDRDTGEISAGSINISDPAYRHLRLGQLPVSYLPILLR